MNKRKKTIKKMAFVLAGAGACLLAMAVLLFLSEGRFITFPRTDLAPVGFALVGAVYLIGAIGMSVITANQKAMIEENDERSKIIEAKSGIVAFVTQTLLLFSGIVLLIFTGYLNGVSALCLLAVLVVSIVVFVLAQTYYGKII